jgi:hypothetical protein
VGTSRTCRLAYCTVLPCTIHPSVFLRIVGGGAPRRRRRATSPATTEHLSRKSSRFYGGFVESRLRGVRRCIHLNYFHYHIRSYVRLKRRKSCLDARCEILLSLFPPKSNFMLESILSKQTTLSRMALFSEAESLGILDPLDISRKISGLFMNNF